MGHFQGTGHRLRRPETPKSPGSSAWPPRTSQRDPRGRCLCRFPNRCFGVQKCTVEQTQTELGNTQTRKNKQTSKQMQASSKRAKKHANEHTVAQPTTTNDKPNDHKGMQTRSDKKSSKSADRSEHTIEHIRIHKVKIPILLHDARQHAQRIRNCERDACIENMVPLVV